MGLRQTVHFILKHPMNSGRPVAALVRFAKWQVQSRMQKEVIFEWIDGAKLAARRGMTGASGNIYCGLHEYADMRFVLDRLQPGDLFVDVGANVGSYTVLASKVCGARTIAVEPDPFTVRALRRNIEVNAIEDRVHVVEAALGAHAGTVWFTVGRDTMNRIAHEGDASTQQVHLKTLDSVLGGEVPTIIKVDVEGLEAEVFEGATGTLSDPRLRAVITEGQDKRVMSLLGAAGFVRKTYVPERRALEAYQGVLSSNALLVRERA
jgi:FkbM family methyltransferase